MYEYYKTRKHLIMVNNCITPISEAWGDFNDLEDPVNLRDYAYDRNGNATMDYNASINKPGDIKYNYLNLPEEIKFNDNARRIKYIYDATGNKLAKVLEADDAGNADLKREVYD